MISLQIKPWVAFGFPYLLIELFYIGIPVVRTDGRTVTWLPNFLGWVDYHISLAMLLRPRARFARGWSSAITAGTYERHGIFLSLGYLPGTAASLSVIVICITDGCLMVKPGLAPSMDKVILNCSAPSIKSSSIISISKPAIVSPGRKVKIMPVTER